MLGEAIHKVGRTAYKLDLGQELKKEVGVVKHVAADDVTPALYRALKDLVDSVVERRHKRFLAVLALSLFDGGELCDRGERIVLEGHTEYLIEHLARLELLGVYRDNACGLGAKLSVKVYADGHASYLSYAGGKVLKLFGKLDIIIRLRELDDKVAHLAKGAALYLISYGNEALLEGVDAGDVKLDLGDAVKIGVTNVCILVVKDTELTDVVENGVHLGKRLFDLGYIHHIPDGLLAILYYLGIHSEKVGQRGIAQAEYLVKAELVADLLGYLGQISSVLVVFH